MKGLLAGLTLCLLISLSLVLVADEVRRGCPPLLASLGQAASRLQGGEWVILSALSDRTPWFLAHAGEARWEFVLEKWRWRIRTATSGGSGWTAAADISSKTVMPTSVSGGF